ncbi:MAG TPA: hypothetical protein VFF73_36440 [Planctomycetota bacterium]|nr:hypothetical protein [Planctomycetota bacterium]
MTTPADDFVQISDGPSYWSHALGALVRPFVIVTPILGVLGALAGLLYSNHSEGGPFVFLGSVLAGITLLVCFLVPVGQANLRRRRDVLLGNLASTSTVSQARVCWTAWLLDAGRRHDGSVHLTRGVVRFLWHQGAAIPITDPRSEMVLELSASAIAAIETEPSGGLGAWWRYGSPLVVLILHDGRRIRFGAYQSEKLASALREKIGKPEGTPVAPTPADFSLDEIGHSLVRRHALVAMIVKSSDGAAPFVVLHGGTEELRGALESARDAVLQERKALAPYAKGLLAGDPRPNP